MIVSIHPMLLFIIEQSLADLVIPVCQYIPCYCSSTTSMLSAMVAILCQYIPCYCSSGEVCGLVPYPGYCQYIPCYCSSNNRIVGFVSAIVVSIHPMLLFIGRTCWNRWNVYYVSIHPMLLFISV